LDLVILMFSATVCVVLLVVAGGLVAAGLVAPETPSLSQYAIGLSSGTSTLLGASLGMLAGRRRSRQGIESDTN